MKKYLLLALVGLCFSFVTGDLTSTKISSHVTMDIHKGLNLIPAGSLSKYQKQIAPMAVYETVDQEVKLVARLIKEANDSTKKPIFSNPAAANSTRDIKIEHMFKRSALLSQFDKITFHQDTIKTINDNDFIVFEYTGTVSGVDNKGEKTTSETYAYYQICYKKNKTYIFNFYCPEAMRTDWEKDAGLMMNSLKIRK